VRLWCVVQGRALLCYAEMFSAVEGQASPNNDDGLHSAVPESIDLERPVLVLWPYDGTLERSSDAVNAPSPHVFTLSAVSGRRHRLCTSSAEQLAQWFTLLGQGGAGRSDDGPQGAPSAMRLAPTSPHRPTDLAAALFGDGLNSGRSEAAASSVGVGSGLPEKQRALLAQRTLTQADDEDEHDSDTDHTDGLNQRRWSRDSTDERDAEHLGLAATSGETRTQVNVKLW
jgi:hypothetical protein